MLKINIAEQFLVLVTLCQMHLCTLVISAVVRKRHTFLKEMRNRLLTVIVLMNIKLKSGFCHAIRQPCCLPMKIVLENFSTLVA